MSFLDYFRTAPPQPPGTALQRVDSGPLSVEGMIERLDSIINTVTGLGGLLDKGRAGYPDTSRRELGDDELTALYKHNGIARRIVDILPSEATRKGWLVVSAGGKADPMVEIDRELELTDRIREGRSMARLYGYAVGLMVTDERYTAQGLEAPMPEKVKAVRALHIFDAREAQPWAWETNPASPNFRRPSTWQITPTIPGSNGYISARGGLVHHSRLLWFRGARLPSSTQGATTRVDASVLQAIWEEVRNLTSIMQGGATLAHEIREKVLHVQGLTGMATSDTLGALEARLSFMAKAASFLGIHLLATDDKYENRSNPPTGFKELSESAMHMLSAVTGIPQILLYGQAPSGFSTDGSSGWETFNRLISAEQEEIRRHLERLYTVVFAASEGPSVKDKDWRIDFMPLNEPSEKEVAEVRKLRAEADAIYIGAAVLDALHVTRSRFGPQGYQDELLPLEEADLNAMESAAEEQAEAMPAGGSVDELVGLLVQRFGQEAVAGALSAGPQGAQEEEEPEEE